MLGCSPGARIVVARAIETESNTDTTAATGSASRCTCTPFIIRHAPIAAVAQSRRPRLYGRKASPTDAVSLVATSLGRSGL